MWPWLSRHIGIHTHIHTRERTNIPTDTQICIASLCRFLSLAFSQPSPRNNFELVVQKIWFRRIWRMCETKKLKKKQYSQDTTFLEKANTLWERQIFEGQLGLCKLYSKCWSIHSRCPTVKTHTHTHAQALSTGMYLQHSVPRIKSHQMNFREIHTKYRKKKRWCE